MRGGANGEWYGDAGDCRGGGVRKGNRLQKAKLFPLSSSQTDDCWGQQGSKSEKLEWVKKRVTKWTSPNCFLILKKRRNA